MTKSVRAKTAVRRRPVAPVRGDASTREKILEAARQEFGELGIRAAKIASICRRADIANGTFYLHYRTKEEVWTDLLKRAAAELGERLRVSHAIKTLDARSRDRLEVSIIVGFAEERREMFGFMMGERSGQVEVHNVFFDQLNAQRCEAIRKGIKRGDFRRGLDPMLTALADIGATTEIIQWWLRNPSAMTREALIERLVHLRAGLLFPD